MVKSHLSTNGLDHPAIAGLYEDLFSREKVD